MDLDEVNVVVLLKRISKENGVNVGKVDIDYGNKKLEVHLLIVMNFTDWDKVAAIDLVNQNVFKVNENLCMNSNLLVDKVFGMDLD